MSWLPFEKSFYSRPLQHSEHLKKVKAGLRNDFLFTAIVFSVRTEKIILIDIIFFIVVFQADQMVILSCYTSVNGTLDQDMA